MCPIRFFPSDWTSINFCSDIISRPINFILVQLNVFIARSFFLSDWTHFLVQLNLKTFDRTRKKIDWMRKCLIRQEKVDRMMKIYPINILLVQSPSALAHFLKI